MKRLRAAHVAARSERGAALVMALLVLVVLTAFGLTLIGLGLTEVAISTNWRDYTKDFYAAEAALEYGVVGLRTLLSTVSDPSTQVTQAQLDSITAALTTPTLTDPGLTFGTCPFPIRCYKISSVAPSYRSTFASGPYAGLFGSVFAYQIRAQVSGQAGTRADLTQVFQYTQVPLFQFGVFYGQGVDLEIAPGPKMDFNGRVHANSNIYVGAGSGGLNFNSYITTAGSIYRRLKRDSAIPWGANPKIKDANGVDKDLNFDSQYQRFSPNTTWANAQAWAAQATSTFGATGKESTVKDSAMGVGQITPPIPDLFQNPTNPDTVARQLIERPNAGDSPALASAKMYSQAGLRIVDGVATDQNGNSVSLPAGGLTTKTFFDTRENRTMTVTELDISILRSAGAFPANGVVYVAGTNLATNPAVRLVNGSQLPKDGAGCTGCQGLTVVSENPVYVRGDYNTLQKVPAAIMGDAITVLSNNWGPNNSDIKGNQSQINPAISPPRNYRKEDRPATNTTVNAAFALGPSAESSLNLGNGQLENVIRFLEDWGGKTFNYSGSIIALWHSLQATGQWACCVYYGPPNRNWNYDTLFNTSPPPGTPQGVIMSKGSWSQS